MGQDIAWHGTGEYDEQTADRTACAALTCLVQLVLEPKSAHEKEMNTNRVGESASLNEAYDLVAVRELRFSTLHCRASETLIYVPATLGGLLRQPIKDMAKRNTALFSITSIQCDRRDRPRW